MRERGIRIVSFDERAAVEFAAVQAARIAAATKAHAPRENAKFDDQIVAIAAIEGATIIYSHDEGIKKPPKGFLRPSRGARLASKGMS
jgi:hypothetical protein